MTAQTSPSRHTAEHLDAWRREGGVVIESFFTPEECAAVRADFATLHGRIAGGEAGLEKKAPGEVGRFNQHQFEGITVVPADCSPALNLIGVHPALIAFAKAAIGVDDVYLYQCQAWAKFTGDADYDQPFHCDYVNHTLVAPSENAIHNPITILCYFNEVTEAHGPAHYVARTDSLKVTGPEGTLTRDSAEGRRIQAELTAYERSSGGPEGTIFPYSIDVFHRGTNMTAPGGVRYALMACYRAAANDSIAFTAWPFHHTKPWRRIFDHATPEQLACFGVQKPGHPFWTETTLSRAQARYPGWDLTPYREAMGR